MDRLLEKIELQEPISPGEVLSLSFDTLLFLAKRAKKLISKKNVSLCSILNAKCGACSEDCSFCAQSCYHATSSPLYPLMSRDTILQAYDAASNTPIKHFSIVTSGGALSSKDVDQICTTIQSRRNQPLLWCASLGCLTLKQLRQLKEAGLSRYHHNLETSKSHFQKVCTTHTYERRVETVINAQKAGLEVCCGGIFGVGESREQRVELACAIRELNVTSIPLNFLIPIPKTPAEKLPRLSKEEVLTTIALFRIICSQAEIRVCGGREHTLKEEDNKIFEAGADGMMIGGYLTQAGAALERDLAMIHNSGLAIS